MKRMLMAALVAATLTACGTANVGGFGSGPSNDPESPVTSSPGQNETPGPGSEVVEPRDGLVDVRPHGWDKASVAQDDRTATVRYWAGVRDCYGLDRVEVDYGKRAVTITVFEGRDPQADVCIELAQAFRTLIELNEPLDGRKLIDGAD